MSALVVGGGMSGLSCAAALSATGIDVKVRDRGRRLGGRMMSRMLRGTGTASDGRVVDIGASYFTVSDPAFAAAVADLMDRGVVREWTDAFHVAGPDGIEGVTSGSMRYAAPAGLRSVTTGLMGDTEVHLDSAVASVAIKNGRVHVDGDVHGAVALCMPLPQALRLSPVFDVEPIAWEPVLVVTCVFDRRHWIELDGVFVNDDSVITWIADDGSRRGDGAPVLVAHVHPVLSAGHLEHPAAVIPAVVAALQRVLRMTALPEWVDVHRWTLAKPLAGRQETHWMDDDAALGLAGDEWAGGPRVEAAWLSGKALGLALAARVGGGS
jgi:predicted NAD/FAD-dependent oxidoreductase